MRPAPDIEGYAPIRSRFNEEDLLTVIRVEYCACGEYVRQYQGESIATTITRHVRGVAHRAWRYSLYE